MEILEEKVLLWLESARFVKSKPGVYVLYDKKLNALYIGESDNLQKEFAKYVTDDVTLIAGAELGGVALAAATAMETGKNWIIVRNSKKGYGTGKMIEGVLEKGDVVLLVEDVATTGGQVLEAAKVITEIGAKLKKIVCTIDRKQGAGENIAAAGYEFESLLTKDDLGIKD